MEFHLIVVLSLTAMFVIVSVGILAVCFKKLFFPSWRDLPLGEYVVTAKGERWVRLAGGCLAKRGSRVKFSSTKSLMVGGTVRIYTRANEKTYTACPAN